MTILVLLCVSFANAATYYVRDGGNGSSPTSSWAGAYDQLSQAISACSRGDTIYVADGSYSGVTFNKSASGSTLITVKKATVADHGTDTGWDNTYGDGQASFSSQWFFSSPYWLVDGITGGGPGSWKTGHGFKVQSGGGAAVLALHAGSGNTTIRHIELQGAGNDGAPSGAGNDAVQYYQGSGPVTISHAWMHDMGRCMFYHEASGTLTAEYCYTEKYESTAAQHSELAVLRATSTFTFRWGVVKHIEGTGGFIGAEQNSTAEIYGNIFHNQSEWGTWGGGNGLIAGFTTSNIRSWKIYNNTFINITPTPIYYGGCCASGSEAHNNYYYQVSAPFFGTQTHEHFQNCTSYGSSSSSGSANPFVSTTPSSADYGKLSANTTAGTSLGAPYDVDMFGNRRTTWTRGAIEFGGGGLTANAGPDQQVTLPNNATLAGSFANLLGGIVSLSWSKVSGPGTVSFSAPSAATTTATFSSAGTYVLRLTATVLTVSASDDVTVAVQPPPDTSAPTVSLTTPTAGTVVSNAVTLSATASDNAGGSGIASVSFLVDGVVVGSDTTSPYSISWNSQTVANGSHTIAARAQDGAGNVATSSSVTITTENPPPDTTPPSVNLTGPTAGAVISDSTTLSATASDNAGGSGVASVSFLVDGVVVGNDTTAPYSLTWNSRLAVNGSRSIQARAVDGAGNQTTSPSVTVTVQNLGPILHLAFDEGQGTAANDGSGLGNNGSCVNGVAWAAGMISQCLAFDGVDDYVRIPSSPSLESVTTELTVSVWAKIEANGQWQAIVRKVLQEGTHEFPYAGYDLIVEESAGVLRARMAVSRADGNRGVVYGNTALSYGQWYHLAGVYDGDSVKIYVNGSADGTAAFTGALVQTDQPLLIGRNGIGGDVLKGALDDFRFYNRVLSDSEIQSLGTTGRPQPPSRLAVIQ